MLWLEQLKARQIPLSIDDFGTGYSSLIYLHSFPFYHRKIDPSFVSRMNVENNNFEILQKILILAHYLEME